MQLEDKGICKSNKSFNGVPHMIPQSSKAVTKIAMTETTETWISSNSRHLNRYIVIFSIVPAAQEEIKQSRYLSHLRVCKSLSNRIADMYTTCKGKTNHWHYKINPLHELPNGYAAYFPWPTCSRKLNHDKDMTHGLGRQDLSQTCCRTWYTSQWVRKSSARQQDR